MTTYLEEINEQPEILREIASRVPRQASKALENLKAACVSGQFDRVVLTGMGTSYFSTYPLFLALTEALPIPVIVLDCSEVIGAVQRLVTKRTLLIVVSQSGESSEIVQLAKLPECAAFVLSISNMPGNALADWSDLALFSKAGLETAVSTKSYTAGLAVLHVVASLLNGRSNQDVREEILYCAEAVAQYLALDIDRFETKDWPLPMAGLAFIGSGFRFASAQTGALVTQEAAKIPAMAFTAGQFRHGPVELIPRGLTTIIFATENGEDANLAERVIESGGKAIVIGAQNSGASVPCPVLPEPCVQAGLTPILDALPIQLMQLPFCEQQGIDAGAFNVATKVT